MNKQNKQTPQQARLRNIIIIVLLLALVGFSIFFIVRSVGSRYGTFTSNDDLVNAISSGEVETVQILPLTAGNAGLYEIVVYIKDGSYGAGNEFSFNFKIYKRVVSKTMMEQIESTSGVPVVISKVSSTNVWSIIVDVLFIALLIGLPIMLFRSTKNMSAGAGNFGASRAKLVREKNVTFDDVAGAKEEKEELAEIVDFLKNPKKYLDIGARIPKGVLLSGEPGTGKTLLARAVAGESDVPFFTISGSEFVELYVGIGASRVRDLFKVAKENSPAIIFIDEIDAVGRQRGAGLGGGNDEREQTLNQLLVEMDGFSVNQGIIVIAATNRPDVLDPALQRPGRFDRRITIDLPDVSAREEILRVHARNKKIDPEVDFSEVAARIPGFSGADIENVLNEAALLAARYNRTTIKLEDIDEGMDRVQMGPAKVSRKYNPAEKRVVAYHEAGHAVIGIKLEDANIVQKVTIIPRGRAGGYNLMVPAEETFLQTKKGLEAMITGYLGGRVAEEVEFKSITTGAYGDFQTATRIARAMVTEYGMSELGPIQYEQSGGNVFLGRDYLNEKNFSDKVAHEIDNAVRGIINRCYIQATEIIQANKLLLDQIAFYLVEVETLAKNDIDEIVETGKLARYDNLKKKTPVAKKEASVLDADFSAKPKE